MSETLPGRIALALLSHTNAGKTTLARTLLRADIGAVMDSAHVTETAESHVLLRSPQGDELVLWDTPGFGDSVRLLRRLEQSQQPLGWFLTQVWDRFADRPFWCSQQALRAARDSADVLLYVANATEDPVAAGYVVPEARILQWLGKPTLVLLNQLGTHADAQRDAELARRWRGLLDRESPGVVREVLSFDAFARCWLQEHVLLDAIGRSVGEDQREACTRLRTAWTARDLQLLDASAGVIARQLLLLAQDAQGAAADSVRDALRRMARSVSGSDTSATPAEAEAQRAMLGRLDAAVRTSTAELVQMHGLTGEAGSEILAQYGGEFATDRAPNPEQAGIIGGLVSGALGGLAADLAAGGLTLGAGALIGGVAGALGARKLTQKYNAERGMDGSIVRWSDDFLGARLEAAVVRYLAIAHYGRGRGEFRHFEPDPRWQEAARTAVASRAELLRPCWTEARRSTAPPPALHEGVRQVLRASLQSLYPEAAERFLALARLTPPA
ncbi:MAG: DUF3482 domain-containing protein [Steroidobacteraceae bacterium]